jgi:hypothetical protein
MAAGGPSYFFSREKVTKTLVSRNASLPHGAFARKQEKPLAAIFLPGHPVVLLTYMQKFAMPFATSPGQLFFPLFAEALLLTEKVRQYFMEKPKSARGPAWTIVESLEINLPLY